MKTTANLIGPFRKRNKQWFAHSTKAMRDSRPSALTRGGSAGTRNFPPLGQNSETLWQRETTAVAGLQTGRCQAPPTYVLLAIKSKRRGLSPVITSMWPCLRFPWLPVSHRKHPDVCFSFLFLFLPFLSSANMSAPNFNSKPCSYVYKTSPAAFILRYSCSLRA